MAYDAPKQTMDLRWQKGTLQQRYVISTREFNYSFGRMEIAQRDEWRAVPGDPRPTAPTIAGDHS